jgi:broad specificity phosphatase PhoE
MGQAESTAASKLRRLTLVRHGETVGQSSIRYFGRTDIPLSDLGVRQMQRVASALAGERFDAAYTSTLCRATAAAEIIAPQLRAIPIDGFNEISFGDWEGLTREEIAQCDPQRFSDWQASPHDFSYPNGDTVSAFRARVAGTFRQLLPALPERTLIVAHRGILSTLLTELLRLSPQQRMGLGIDLASIHVVCGAPDWRAECLNRTDHLEGL